MILKYDFHVGRRGITILVAGNCDFPFRRVLHHTFDTTLADIPPTLEMRYAVGNTCRWHSLQCMYAAPIVPPPTFTESLIGQPISGANGCPRGTSLLDGWARQPF